MSETPFRGQARHPGQAAETIPVLAQLAGEHFGDAEAVVDGDRRMTFAELAADARDAARAFIATGLEPGDRVAIWAPNSYEWVVSVLGLQSAGGALVPLNTRFKGPEAFYVLKRSRAKVLVSVGTFLGVDYPKMLREQLREHELPHLEHRVVVGGVGVVGGGGGGGGGTLGGEIAWEDFLALGKDVSDEEVTRRMEAIAPDAVSDVIFTSGTTGAPKGVVATHGQSIRTFSAWAGIVGLRAGDKYLIVNPMFHTFGYKAGIIACLITGATMVPAPVFDLDAVLDAIASEHITVLPGPPTLYQSLLNHPRLKTTDISSLRLAVTGAAVIPVDLVRRIRSEHIWIRATLPRLRYDQLMSLGWRTLLPFATANLIVVSIWIVAAKLYNPIIGLVAVIASGAIAYGLYKAILRLDVLHRPNLASRKVRMVDSPLGRPEPERPETTPA